MLVASNISPCRSGLAWTILVVLLGAVCLVAAIVALALWTGPAMKPLRITLDSITSDSQQGQTAT